MDIVADTCTELSIKTVERKKRGTSSKILIQSSKSKILRKFSQFLNNGKNKENILKIISSVIVENREKVLEILKKSNKKTSDLFNIYNPYPQEKMNISIKNNLNEKIKDNIKIFLLKLKEENLIYDI